MWSDLRNAIRALSGAPGFTATALLVLALGIGGSTAIFSVVDAIVLRGLPFDDANRLVAGGAQRGDIAGMVLRGAAIYVGTGLVAGIGIAIGMSRIVKSFLFNVAPTEPIVYIAIAVLVIAVALAAALVPARRASRVDPIVALRSS
jgi:hypothetical protein